MVGIVVGVDGSEQSRHALEWAARDAEARGVDVLILRSWHEPLIGGAGATWSAEYDEVVHDAKSELDAVAAEVHDAHPTVAVLSALVDAHPVKALLARAASADLVVLGSRGAGGFLGLELGSVSLKVARRSPVPVVVVRGDHDLSDHEEVVVGVDGSACSRHALRWAADWAHARGKRLVALLAWNYLEPERADGAHGFEPTYTSADAEAALRTIVADVLDGVDGPDIALETVCDLPARAVMERAAEASLLVVGRHGIGRWGSDMGSTNGQILHHATVPVAVIPEVAAEADTAAD